MKTNTVIDPLLQAVIRVWHGRGFVVEHGHRRLILTAAHCLPAFPEAASRVLFGGANVQGAAWAARRQNRRHRRARLAGRSGAS